MSNLELDAILLSECYLLVYQFSNLNIHPGLKWSDW